MYDHKNPFEAVLESGSWYVKRGIFYFCEAYAHSVNATYSDRDTAELIAKALNTYSENHDI